MAKRANLNLDFCPFCGGDRVRVHSWTQKGPQYVGQCLTMGCGAQGPRRHTEREAIEAWNARSTQ